MQKALDIVRAHWKAIAALLSALLIQFVDSETADWIVVVVGTIIVGAVPNNQAAVRRIYGR